MKTEKIFEDLRKPALKLLNLHNVLEAYGYQQHFVRSLYKEKLFDETQFIRKVITRGMGICEVQEEMVREGKIPHEEMKKQDEDYFEGVYEEEDLCAIEVIEEQ